MNRLPDLPRTTRRQFLQRSGQAAGLLAFHSVAPSFLARAAQAGLPAAERDRPILVLVQLAGGNDGLNTLIPHTDPFYHSLRPRLGIPSREVLPITADLGLHPSCGRLHQLYADGGLSIVQNVGYPNPNRSHFRSMEIWESASGSDETLATGWLGRYFDHACAGAPEDGSAGNDPPGIYLTSQTPWAFSSEQHHGIYGVSDRGGGRPRDRELLQKLALIGAENNPSPERHFLSHTLMDALAMDERVDRIFRAYRPEARYPGSRLAQTLRGVASLISANYGTRIYFVSHGGFDTHVGQATQHARLLGELSEALGAFQEDLQRRKLADQVLTMTFSEFGRRPMENESMGTDHGTAAPLFVMGPGLRETLVGSPPDLDIPANGDLAFSTDFRQVYATVLQRWLHAPVEPILGQAFDPLPIL